MLEAPEPRVMEEPGTRVWLEMTYWDWVFGVMVSEPMVSRAGALPGGMGRVRGEVGFVTGGEGVSPGGALELGRSVGAVFSVCMGDCVFFTGASVVAGPSSDSVDVEVFVIYNAVCNAIAGLCIGRT